MPLPGGNQTGGPSADFGVKCYFAQQAHGQCVLLPRERKSSESQLGSNRHPWSG